MTTVLESLKKNCKNLLNINIKTAKIDTEIILASVLKTDRINLSTQHNLILNKSQDKNKAKAMTILRSRLYEAERLRLENERSVARKSQIGTGDRSERIRTYNFPQGRVSDHRINLTLHKLTGFLAGDDFAEMSDALQMKYQEELLENDK